MLEGLTREGRRSHPGDGVGGPSDRVRRVFGIAPTGGGGDKVYHWPNIPPPFTPRAMRFWACGPGGWTPGSPGRRSPGPVGAIGCQ